MNGFAKKNYARSQLIKAIKSQLNNATKDYNKTQLEEFVIFIENYKHNFESLKNEFESVVSVNEQVQQMACYLSICDYKEKLKKDIVSQREEFLKLQSYENSSFLQKFDVGYARFKELEKKIPLAEKRLEFFGQFSSTTTLAKLLENVADTHIALDSPESFEWYVEEAIKILKENELRSFKNRFKELGISFGPKTNKGQRVDHRTNLKDTENRYLANPRTFIFHYRPITSGYGISFKVKGFKLVFNYFEKWKIFRTDERVCVAAIKSKIAKINKLEAERNLRAMAADRTQRQRNIADTHRSEATYQEQIERVPYCPYCSSNLGAFSGVQSAQLDHIHPVSKGGLSTSQNLVYVCFLCNSQKGNLTLNTFIRRQNLNRQRIFDDLDLLEKDY